MPEQSDIAAAVEAGRYASLPSPIDTSDGARFWVQLVPAGAEAKVIDTAAEAWLGETYLPHPTRKVGTYRFRDVDSFVAYWERHQTLDTEVYADATRGRVLAVIDGHGEIEAGHGDHLAVLALEPTPAWTAWLAQDRRYLQQAAFVDHVEDRLPDFIEPSSATFLEIAQSFRALRKVDFESGHRAQSGQTTIEFRETLDAKAGAKGHLEIPERFSVAVAPWFGSPPIRVTARLRYRIEDGRLLLGYVLDRIEDVRELAFADVVEQVRAGVGQVWMGWPTEVSA